MTDGVFIVTPALPHIIHETVDDLPGKFTVGIIQEFPGVFKILVTG
jgi:hypothetical protein